MQYLPQLHIEILHTNASVAAQGHVQAYPFVFSAVGSEWRFAMSTDEHSDPAGFGSQHLNGVGVYGRYDSATNSETLTMPADIARRLVECCAYAAYDVEGLLRAAGGVIELGKEGKPLVEPSLPQLQIHYLGDNVPVQAMGTVSGLPFYFRARNYAWRFSIAKDSDTDPVDVESPQDGFDLSGSYGLPGSQDAGYMPCDLAQRLIERGAQCFLDIEAVSHPPSQQAQTNDDVLTN